MTTHTEVSKVNPTLHTPSVTKAFIWALGLVIVLALIFAAIVYLVQPGNAGAIAAENPVLQAWSARNQGLAAEYALIDRQQALDTWASRYQGLADQYAIVGDAATTRVLDAWSGRYQGAAADYASEQASMPERALATWSERYQGLADSSNK